MNRRPAIVLSTSLAVAASLGVGAAALSRPSTTPHQVANRTRAVALADAASPTPAAGAGTDSPVPAPPGAVGRAVDDRFVGPGRGTRGPPTGDRTARQPRSVDERAGAVDDDHRRNAPDHRGRAVDDDHDDPGDVDHRARRLPRAG